MRLKSDIKPKEATFQVVLDALALTPFYHAFLITAYVPAIYISHQATISNTVKRSLEYLSLAPERGDVKRHKPAKFPDLEKSLYEWILQYQEHVNMTGELIIEKAKKFMKDINIDTTQAQQKALDDALVTPADHLESSIRFTINKKKVSLDVDIFRDILQFFPKILGQVFEDLLLEQDILSIIRDLGHTGDITYLTDVNVDYLHQPWRAFATVINKCLSGKETGMDKIRLSHLLFQTEYKDAKKTNKMSYPRFTKIIIDYFMSKDLSISRRNKMFWHTARDDTLFTSMRCISRHEDTQSKAKVDKPNKKKQPVKKTKAKGLVVLSEVALTEAKQLKPATKRSKTQFHSSYTSGLCDGVDTQSKVLDEHQQKTSSIDEGTGTIPGVPYVPPYESKSDKESWGDSEDEDDNDDDGDNDDDDQTKYEEEDVDDRVRTPSDYELTDEDKIDDEETMEDEEDDEVIKELYDDVNANLGNDDTEMTDANQGASS
ncbi:retrovirus-related pol polyprotein from transposon TNT 1-94 [Tanacetum coccineum]